MGLGIGVRVVVGIGETLGVTVGDIVGVALGAGVIVGVRIGVAVGVAVGLGEGVRVGDSAGVGVAVGVGVREIVSVGVAVGDGVAVGELDGVASGSVSVVEVLFCGWEIVLVIKLFRLLSVSSLLPVVTSVPLVIDSVVEAATAFLSALELLAGLDVAVSSLSAAEPNPTLSTRVVPASL